MDTSVGNRFSPYGPENHSAPLWITSILGLIYAVGVLVIRIFIKRRVFGWDDTLVVAATLIGLVQAVLFFKALQSGLGQIPENVPDLSKTASLSFASQVLLLAALYLAKCSGVLLLRRLFVRDHQTISRLCDISLGFTVFCGIATVILSSVGCPTSGFFNEHCGSQNTRWSVITALDVVTEVILLLLPAYLVWQLQMKTSYKLRVIVAFCFRILVILFSIFHLTARIRYTDRGQPSPFNIVSTLIWHQTLLAWSLISTTIPNLKAFLQSLSANWGGADWGYTVKAYGNGTFEMKNMGSSSRPTASGMASGAGTETATYMDHKYDAQIHTRQAGERNSLGSSGSQDLIIHKETAWTVVRS
ncbi:hypothetical protein BU23DRAFT_456954 [Bimuria novae-zelandiae CBS 107.79]|uniref:Rhodopsin domain-containing protein n=1 Tax=Bimuria novae-zelandiae CBS 107.79 TaxID=1447943 RepID=A0A6A5VEL3_9PLEO|nr:hypothetical protein BU23DRAFT_456954 [Bimuria novae-zelandiae CBS 107.79]